MHETESIVVASEETLLHCLEDKVSFGCQDTIKEK